MFQDKINIKISVLVPPSDQIATPVELPVKSPLKPDYGLLRPFDYGHKENDTFQTCYAFFSWTLTRLRLGLEYHKFFFENSCAGLWSL